MRSLLSFPTTLHQQVAELARDFFLTHPCVDTILIVNSCSRGQATPESDLDMAVLVKPTMSVQDLQNLETLWQNVLATDPHISLFRRAGRFRQVHLDFFDGQFTPSVWDDGGGPDSFEVEVGNRIAYAVPFCEVGSYFQQLQAKWLPYYDNDLWLRRLLMVREACAYDLEHVPFFLSRGLYFQAFDRLYKAFQEFLQALFITQRTYPVAYNKWVREQVESWLGLPELYRKLPPILSVGNLESTELLEKVIQVNLGKLNVILRAIQKYSQDNSLKPSKTIYKSWGKGVKTLLRFSKSGDRNIEEAYSTHYVKPKGMMDRKGL